MPGEQPIHAVTEVAWVVVEYAPIPQRTQVSIDVEGKIDDHVPVLQGMHIGAAIIDDHVPALQLRQDTDPAKLHRPAVHDEHVKDEVAATAVEKVPAIQLVHSAALPDDQLPGTQSMHVFTDVATTKDDHLPAEHEIQIEDDDALTIDAQKPAPQLVHDRAKEADQVPALQFVQVKTDVAPDVPDHVPELHPTH